MQSLKPAALAMGLLVTALVSAWGVRAQQNKGLPFTGGLTTNWIGYFVFGSEDTGDAIARGPHPTTDRQVQVGLRSDGVVVWRRAPSSP